MMAVSPAAAVRVTCNVATSSERARVHCQPSCSVSSSSSSSSSFSRPWLSSRTSLAGGSGFSMSAARAAPSHARRDRHLTIVADIGGNYGDSFHDVDKVLVSYFTFRALKDTLAQLQETDCSPGKQNYKWLYNFASENNPNDSKAFIKALFAERQEYGQRILAQRQTLFEGWQKGFVPETVATIIEKQNLEHLREHLFCTVNLSDDKLAKNVDTESCIQPSEYQMEMKKEDETAA